MSSDFNSTSPNLQTGLLSREQFSLAIQIYLVLWLALGVGGTLTNLANLGIFLKLGLTDSVNVTFFYQSLVDVGVTAFTLMHSLTILLRILQGQFRLWFEIDPYVFTSFFANLREFFYAISFFTTTLLAVIRCLCVHMPLKFKDVFTTSRTFAVLFALTVIALAFKLPSLAALEVFRVADKSTNRSRVVVRYSDDFSVAMDVEYMAVNVVLTILTQCTVVVCLLVIVRGLRKSTKFRQRCLGEAGVDSAGSLQGKELQAVQQVTMVCLLFVICNVPKIIIVFCRLALPDMDIGARLENLLRTLLGIRISFEALNCSLNFFIYFRYSSSFRGAFRSLWTSQSDAKG